MPAELLAERRDHTLLLTLSDPATRNALSPQVHAAGIETLQLAGDDAGIRCIVLRGDGLHFSAGTDVHRLALARAQGEDGRDAQRQAIEQVHGFVEAIRACPKPVVAAVEGSCAGAGFSLALACDLMVAADDARFETSGPAPGLPPEGGAGWHLARQLPRAAALELLWLGEPPSALRLQQWGLVQQVTPPGQATHQALRLAERLAALPPDAVSGVKDLVSQAPVRRLREQLDAERELFIEALLGGDAGIDQRAQRLR